MHDEEGRSTQVRNKYYINICQYCVSYDIVYNINFVIFILLFSLMQKKEFSIERKNVQIATAKNEKKNSRTRASRTRSTRVPYVLSLLDQRHPASIKQTMINYR